MENMFKISIYQEFYLGHINILLRTYETDYLFYKDIEFTY